MASTHCPGKAGRVERGGLGRRWACVNTVPRAHAGIDQDLLHSWSLAFLLGVEFLVAWRHDGMT